MAHALVVLFCCLLVATEALNVKPEANAHKQSVTSSHPSHTFLQVQYERPRKHIVTAACGANRNYADQTVRLLKSIVLSQTTHFTNGMFDWVIWLVMDDAMKQQIQEQVETISKVANVSSTHAHTPAVHIMMKSVTELSGVSDLNMGLGLCSNVKNHRGLPLDMYEVLPLDVEDFLYMDADQLAVGDLAQIWNQASGYQWEKSKLMAMTEECVEPRGKCGWYNKHRRKENVKIRFGDNGLNSGSMLISVANMKRCEFAAWVSKAYAKYNGSLFLGDQDLVNIYFKEHPEQFVMLQCNANVRTDSACDIEKLPPIVLHGNRHVFVSKPGWKHFAEKVDGIFNDLIDKKTLVGGSLWEAVGQDVRKGLQDTLSKPQGLSPVKQRTRYADWSAAARVASLLFVLIAAVLGVIWSCARKDGVRVVRRNQKKILRESS